jgi:hypothetical protein
MRNLYLLETPKPSRLHLGKSGLVLCDLVFNPTTINSQHVYITSDEKLKAGEYCITFGSDKCKGQLDTFQSNVRYSRNPRKIILTTDPDLIKDGVQELDDEFLQWFVNNSSCEKVEVELIDTFKKTNEVYVDEITGGNYYEIIKKYKIIIPKEETKQETRVFGTKEDKPIQVGQPDKQERTGSLVECIQNIINDQLKVISEIEKYALEEPDKWSLEKAKEFALNYFKKSNEVPSKGMFTYELLLRILEAGIECGYKFGTKHQASVKYREEDRFEGSQPKSQRMFSEMQVHQIIELIRITGLSPEFIMKQFNEK